jgi:hypothetical protein
MEESFDRLLISVKEHFKAINDLGSSDLSHIFTELDNLQDLMLSQCRSRASEMFLETEALPEQRMREVKQTAVKLRVFYELMEDFKAC